MKLRVSYKDPEGISPSFDQTMREMLEAGGWESVASGTDIATGWRDLVLERPRDSSGPRGDPQGLGPMRSRTHSPSPSCDPPSTLGQLDFYRDPVEEDL
jgi:hypothetical protein